VYEATGASQLSFRTIEQLGANGIFVFTGVPGRKHRADINTDKLMRNIVLKNQVVFGSVNASKVDFQNAIGDLAWFNEKWPDALKSIITGRYSMELHGELLLGPARGIKNVITIAQ
jgi:hypothetical protein